MRKCDAKDCNFWARHHDGKMMYFCDTHHHMYMLEDKNLSLKPDKRRAVTP
jgi:predicted TIM-barrel fold metal-dependent hydrolase